MKRTLNYCIKIKIKYRVDQWGIWLYVNEYKLFNILQCYQKLFDKKWPNLINSIYHKIFFFSDLCFSQRTFVWFMNKKYCWISCMTSSLAFNCGAQFFYLTFRKWFSYWLRKGKKTKSEYWHVNDWRLREKLKEVKFYHHYCKIKNLPTFPINSFLFNFKTWEV